MNKTLSKSKNKKIVGGNKFTFDESSLIEYNNRTEFKGKKENNEVTIIFYKKKDKNTQLSIKVDDIKDDRNLKIITSNITDAKYYEPNMDKDNGNGKLLENKIVTDMNKFDTCVIVVFEKISYIFLYVYTSGNKAIKEFDNSSENNNLKVLNALMVANFKELGLDIKFVNKFVVGVKGYIEEKSHRVIQQVIAGGKKINTNKILNNLIFKLSKINNVKKPTKPKPKATKPTKPKPTKSKPKATKATKPKLTKPKVTKPKATKKI